MKCMQMQLVRNSGFHIAFIILIILDMFWISFSSAETTDNTIDGITVREGAELANERAINQNKNFTLVLVKGNPSTSTAGYFSSISFIYWVPQDITSRYNRICYGYKVSSDCLVETMPDFLLLNNEEPISNWTVDSPDAFSIAKSNSLVNKFLYKYPNAEMDEFQLFVDSNVHNKVVWYIHWISWDESHPYDAHVFIDANTGEILEINADLKSKEREFHLGICDYFAIIILVIIICTIIYIIKCKRKRKQQKKNNKR